MVKDTVRYPDAVVEEIETLVEETPLESKSEFYRFSAELTLGLIDPEYTPEMFHFEDIREELGVDLEPEEPGSSGDSAMLEALITVRKHCMRGDFDGAEAYIDENFVDIDRETMVLEEVLTMYRDRYEDGN
jgi:Arc/MetJ-type ribon-helix-helix transcriptional regulator